MLDLDSWRDGTETSWSLPGWHQSLGRSVFPLMLRRERRLIPIGTAYCISKTGLVATATHCVLEALKHEPSGQLKNAPGQHDLQDVALYILHYSVACSGIAAFRNIPIDNLAGDWENDAILGVLRTGSTNPPLVPIPLSCAVPRIGSQVRVVGYHDFDFPEGGIDLDEVEAREFRWADRYSHQLRVSEGSVEAIFLRRFAAGFGGGPCFATTAQTVHGQSGGPVMSGSGFSCGVHSLRFGPEDWGVESLLFPPSGHSSQDRGHQGSGWSLDDSAPYRSDARRNRAHRRVGAATPSRSQCRRCAR